MTRVLAAPQVNAPPEVVFGGVGILTRPGAVMTPLATTEALVDWAVAWIGPRVVRAADVGTGSGAVAVALARRAPGARIWATDDSEAAVELARANVARHGLEERVEVLLGDLLEPVPCELDLVVANLPYLVEARAGGAAPPYRAQPEHALYAPDGGLRYYRGLIEACRTRLQPGGAIAIQLYGCLLATRASHLDRFAQEIESLARERRSRAAARSSSAALGSRTAITSDPTRSTKERET